MLTELMQRSLGDGSQTVITLYRDTERDACVIEAVNVNGVTSCDVADGDALEAFAHPFSRPEWLSYPGTTREAREQMRPLSEVEYALLEALSTADDEVKS